MYNIIASYFYERFVRLLTNLSLHINYSYVNTL